MITPKRASMICQRYDELKELGKKFVNEIYPKYSFVEFHYNGYVEIRYNRSCSCHPEFEYKSVDSKEFFEWLIKYNSKHE